MGRGGEARLAGQLSCAATGRVDSSFRIWSAISARIIIAEPFARVHDDPMDDAEAQVQCFIDKFDPENAALIRDLRAALRARLPGCAELVYDNYNFFVIGFSPTMRPSDYIVSIAASASGAGLSFNRGAELHDPDHILQGSGKVNRFIRLSSAEVLTRPEVELQ